jgi:hypothetical protein
MVVDISGSSWSQPATGHLEVAILAAHDVRRAVVLEDQASTAAKASAIGLAISQQLPDRDRRILYFLAPTDLVT